MSLERIEAIMGKLKRRAYHWAPVRRTYIEKRNSKKLRPLGMPGWTDKLLEEVLRMVLEAYYEPYFRDSSHGFRPQRGCHTALEAISKWKGARWFIEGDIKGCFDNISHDVIIGILRRKIKDNTFLKLVRDMLEAGYMENWKYYGTYSGTPQGHIVSPLLANIVLNELDRFIEDELIPKYTQGKHRKRNPEYKKLEKRAYNARKKGQWKYANALRKVYTKLSSQLSGDPEFRRLWYVRYADDFILGFIGTRQEARMIKQEIGNFLKSMELEMSEEKTFITHAQTGKARFLNYQINLSHADNVTVKAWNGKSLCRRRAVNQQIYFSIPQDVIKKWEAKVCRKGKVTHRPELLHLSDYDIIRTYEIQLQGLINYYNRAHNVGNRMSYLRQIWEQSLTKTLAAKHKTKVSTIYKNYRKFYTVDEDGHKRKLIGVEILRAGKKPLKAVFGKKKIYRETRTVIKDEIQTLYITRNQLIDRMLADTCESCGKETDILHGHHIRKLADLKKKYRGRRSPPEWVKKMIAIRRKSLFVCFECHQKIHAGTYDGKKLA
jgi:group II intron reverse transcriptase/maturase